MLDLDVNNRGTNPVHHRGDPARIRIEQRIIRGRAAVWNR